jgi:glycosyltransferase involved in cell wall biosynthesis
LIPFLIPGRLDTPTGGYIYDRRIIEGLRASGLQVEIKSLSSLFPFPDQAALDAAARTLADIPSGTLVVIDGLAGGAMPAQIEHEAARLRLVALVHHPLARETGLPADAVRDLHASEQRTLSQVRHVIVTSRATAELLTQDFGVAPERLSVIEPGTDPGVRSKGSANWAQLLCVASVTPRKGHVTLVRALARLTDLDWTLVCVGSMHRDPVAPLRVLKEIAKAKLNERVIFKDEVKDSAALSPYYQRADIFVLPTEYEGYGMAVAEALAHGLPVVSTPTGGIEQLVGADAGILVPPGDAAALAAALRRLITDRAEYERLRAGAWAVGATLPTWEAQAKRMAAALATV